MLSQSCVELQRKQFDVIDADAGQQLPWPNARSGHRLLATEHDLWLVGGFSPADNELGGVLYEEVWQYNIAAGQWRLLRTSGRMPKELASHAAVVDAPYLLVHGGTAIPFGETRSSRMHRLNLDTLKWTEIALSPLAGDQQHQPDRLYGHTLTLADRDDRRVIYQIGGTTGHDYSNSVHELDLLTWQWRLVPPATEERGVELPTERYRHEILHWRQQLIVVGGGTAFTVCELGRLPAFDVRRQRWRWLTTRPDPRLGAVPQARRCHCCLQHGDWAMLTGGCAANNEPLSDVWYLHLPSLSWSSGHSLPRPMFFHAGAVTPSGEAFLFGGITKGHDGNTCRMKRLYRCWFPSPQRLERLCLLLVLQRSTAWLRSRRHTVKQLPSKLLQLGVPPHLVMDCLPSDWRGWREPPTPPA